MSDDIESVKRGLHTAKQVGRMLWRMGHPWCERLHHSKEQQHANGTSCPAVKELVEACPWLIEDQHE